jgi:hypothetical protein
VPIRSELDRNWDALMALCEQEREFTERGEHPKVLRHIKRGLDQLAADMGFSPTKIRTRDFRARKQGGRIVGLDTT